MDKYFRSFYKAYDNATTAQDNYMSYCRMREDRELSSGEVEIRAAYSKAYKSSLTRLRNKYKGERYSVFNLCYLPSIHKYISLSYFNERWNIDLFVSLKIWEQYIPKGYKDTSDFSWLLVLLGILSHPEATTYKINIAMERLQKEYIDTTKEAQAQPNVKSFLDFISTTYFF